MHNVELHTLLGNVGKGLLSWLQTMQQTGTLRKGEAAEASHDGQLFQHSLVRRVKIEVRPAVELYFNELLIQKCKFRGRFQVSILSLDKLPRRLHATLTNPAWITHLLRNIFANSDVECILRAKTLRLNLTGEIGWPEVRNCAKLIFLRPC